MISYFPLSHAEARGWPGQHTLAPRIGYAATAALLSAAGFARADAEDAGYVALTSAGVAALLDPTEPKDTLRLVAAVETDSVIDRDDPYGEVELGPLSWSALLAFYADEAEARPLLVGARTAVAAADTIADASARPEVIALLEAHDLLWYDPTEVDRLD